MQEPNRTLLKILKKEPVHNSSLMMVEEMIEGRMAVRPVSGTYSYRCSRCRLEMKVNEAIIDVEIGIAEFEGRWHEGFMPVLGCPGCNRKAMEYVGA